MIRFLLACIAVVALVSGPAAAQTPAAKPAAANPTSAPAAAPGRGDAPSGAPGGCGSEHEQRGRDQEQQEHQKPVH